MQSKYNYSFRNNFYFIRVYISTNNPRVLLNVQPLIFGTFADNEIGIPLFRLPIAANRNSLP